ncbi:hypothetical protein F5Y15DRAFT_429576 [Xylariaceae sp. FL0016]|nr:hypothetical protein F5Y15DRAFT_429576 [Xylariaceae sp. FL0016]
MGVKEWMQESIEEFFTHWPEPTQEQCDQKASSLFDSSSITPIGMQGSLSYTLLASTIISFRVPEAKLGSDVEKLARKIHGAVVPEATFRGKLEARNEENKPLYIYTMPFLRGQTCLETTPFVPQLSEEQIAKHINYVQLLARFFARNWLNPQKVDAKELQLPRDDIKHKLTLLENDERFAYMDHAIKDRRGPRGIDLLFSEAYPQVLTHGDFSGTNILLDGDDHSITGLIDWSLAGIKPFGMELFALRSTSGNMNGNGYSDYTCRDITDGAFWDEFWKVTKVEDNKARETIKTHAELACKMGLILAYAFTKTLDGKALDVLDSRPTRFLYEWLKRPRWSDIVLRETDRPTPSNEVGEA